MSKKALASLSAAELLGKRVLVRVDFNVPLDEQGKITDDTRIRAALPTIKHLTNHGAKVILASHFGRPKGKVNEAMRLTPVAERLSELLDQDVIKCDDCVGDAVAAAVAGMQNGQVAMLETSGSMQKKRRTTQNFLRSWHL